MTIDRSQEVLPETGRAVGLVCSQDGKVVHDEIFVFDPQQPFGSDFAAGDAALLARELLPLPDPDIVTSPPADRPQLAGLSTWFAVGTAWQTFSATATLGGVSATVTATPSTVVWDPGDGAPTVTCDGPGRTFDRDDPDATSDCTHTYTVATGPGALALTATITYEVAWTATDGSGDVLDPVTRTATVPITVGQVQAVIR